MHSAGDVLAVEKQILKWNVAVDKEVIYTCMYMLLHISLQEGLELNLLSY